MIGLTVGMTMAGSRVGACRSPRGRFHRESVIRGGHHILRLVGSHDRRQPQRHPKPADEALKVFAVERVADENAIEPARAHGSPSHGCGIELGWSPVAEALLGPLRPRHRRTSPIAADPSSARFCTRGSRQLPLEGGPDGLDGGVAEAIARGAERAGDVQLRGPAAERERRVRRAAIAVVDEALVGTAAPKGPRQDIDDQAFYRHHGGRALRRTHLAQATQLGVHPRRPADGA